MSKIIYKQNLLANIYCIISPVEERCIRAPAERIAVLDCASLHKPSELFEMSNNLLICVLDVHSLKIDDRINKVA